MDELFRVLAASVWRYLDGTVSGDPNKAPTTADARILGAAWRALLRLHDADDDECARCERGHAGSCTVWQIAIGYFVRRPPR